MMKNKAFTLIELLVVVLIIGILAAVALPQYRKAVDKARLMEMLVQGRALLEAQQLYVVTNGKMSTDLEELDISFPNNYWSCFGGNCSSPYTNGISFEISSYHGYGHLAIYCKASPENTYAQGLCISLGGKESHSTSTTIYYEISQK